MRKMQVLGLDVARNAVSGSTKNRLDKFDEDVKKTLGITSNRMLTPTDYENALNKNKMLLANVEQQQLGIRYFQKNIKWAKATGVGSLSPSWQAITEIQKLPAIAEARSRNQVFSQLSDFDLAALIYNQPQWDYKLQNSSKDMVDRIRRTYRNEGVEFSIIRAAQSQAGGLRKYIEETFGKANEWVAKLINLLAQVEISNNVKKCENFLIAATEADLQVGQMKDFVDQLREEYQVEEDTYGSKDPDEDNHYEDDTVKANYNKGYKKALENYLHAIYGYLWRRVR